MSFRTWNLKRRLAKAAGLHKKGLLTDAEYSAFAVWSIERLKRDGAALRPREMHEVVMSWVAFGIQAGHALRVADEEWPKIDFEAGIDRYGPYNKAVHWLTTATQGPPDAPVADTFEVPWNDRADRLLTDAKFKLSKGYRGASAMEHLFSESQARLPTVFKAVVWFLTTVAAFILGRVTK